MTIWLVNIPLKNISVSSLKCAYCSTSLPHKARVLEINFHDLYALYGDKAWYVNWPKYSEQKYQTHVYTLTADLTAIPIGNSTPLEIPNSIKNYQ